MRRRVRMVTARLQIGQPFRSRDAFGSCSLRHHAAAAAFTTAQAFDELGNWGSRLDPEANEITLGDDATVPTAQAAHHYHPTWTLYQVTHCGDLASFTLFGWNCKQCIRRRHQQ